MDASSDEWIAELGIMGVALLEYDETLSSESFTSCTTDEQLFGKAGFVLGAPHHSLCFERPTKVVKTSRSWDSSNNNEQILNPSHYNRNIYPSSTTPYYLSFTNSISDCSPPQNVDSKEELMLKPKVELDFESMNTSTNGNSHVSCDNQVINEVLKERPVGVNKRARSSSMAASIPNSLGHEHVIAERKRREKLSERLIALSALIPGLKKMDKASVLGEAVKYLKELQEQVKILEEKAKCRNVESLVLVNKSRVYMDDDEDANSSSSNQETCNLRPEEAALPEIEARVVDKDVLIRIHCEKQQGLFATILNEMENLQLSVTNSNSMPFGNYDLIITITAQMEENFCITTKDLVSKLRTVF